LVRRCRAGRGDCFEARSAERKRTLGFSGGGGRFAVQERGQQFATAVRSRILYGGFRNVPGSGERAGARAWKFDVFILPVGPVSSGAIWRINSFDRKAGSGGPVAVQGGGGGGPRRWVAGRHNKTVDIVEGRTFQTPRKKADRGVGGPNRGASVAGWPQHPGAVRPPHNWRSAFGGRPGPPRIQATGADPQSHIPTSHNYRRARPRGSETGGPRAARKRGGTITRWRQEPAQAPRRPTKDCGKRDRTVVAESRFTYKGGN